jgi:hypothetical protein
MKSLIGENKGLILKILMVWFSILLMAAFWLSWRSTSGPVSISVMPQAPQKGEPVIATFNLNNPTSQAQTTDFSFYANGDLLRDGTVTIPPGSSQSYQEVYTNELSLGDQISFSVITQSDQGSYEKTVAIPPYPPALWTSFISFATFSTSIMNTMTSMVYYNSNFTGSLGANLGLILSLVLLALLVFLELFSVSRGGSGSARSLSLGRLQVRLTSITWVLLIIFLGMVYTRVMMILLD